MADGKWIRGLTPGTPVADAARVALAARFEVVRHYLPLAVGRPFENAEYVHQLRVGTRRAAAALRAFADCLPRKHLRRAKAALRGIRRAAGDARDWDVFLHSLTKARPADSPAEEPAFDFLLGYALGERSAAQGRLAQAAADAGPGFGPASAVLPARARDPESDDTPRAFGDVAFARLGEMLGDLTAAVEANPTEPEPLHQLRILGKRVRYAIELFADCFAPPLADEIYPAVEELQETLGDLQDAAVGTARLEGVRERARQAVPAEWARVEAGVEGLLRTTQRHIPEARERFAAWRDVWLRRAAERPLESLRLPVVG